MTEFVRQLQSICLTPPLVPAKGDTVTASTTEAPTSDVYFDPYDVGINSDPYPTFRRLREEAPLYYNAAHDFFALSRFADVNKALVDHETFSSARGAIIELIKANIEIPPGTVIFEDPPIHDIHRKLLARMFTPRKVNALEPKIRDYCAQSLDPLIGADRFDFVADLGAQMPMKVISALLGIPEDDQEMIRDHANAQMRTEAGKPMKPAEGGFVHRRDVRGLHRLARRAPVGRHHDRTAQRGVRRRDRHDPAT